MVVVYHRFYCTAVYHRFYSCDYSCALFLASLQESNKGKSFEHTNLDTGGFLGQGISGKIYIGKSRMKVSPTAKMWRRTPKCSRQLTKQKNGCFAKVPSIFASFSKFPRVLVAAADVGAKSHPAAAPWWIMKVI